MDRWELPSANVQQSTGQTINEFLEKKDDPKKTGPQFLGDAIDAMGGSGDSSSEVFQILHFHLKIIIS